MVVTDVAFGIDWNLSMDGGKLELSYCISPLMPAREDNVAANQDYPKMP